MNRRVLLLFFFSVLFISHKLWSAGPTWTQTDWSGGDGQDAWSDTTKYQSDDESNVIDYPTGAVKIKLTVVDIGDGSDGSLTVSTENNVIIHYTYLVSDVTSGNTIPVNDGSNFTNNDQILIIQMQHTDSTAPGTYEFRTITSGGGTNTLTLDSNLTNDFYSDTSSVNDTTASITQVVRVPQYTTVTVQSGGSITANAWDGLSGGIIVFRAVGKISVESGGAITSDGLGFRGGNPGGQDGYRGEGWRGGNPRGGYNNADPALRAQNYGGGGTYVNGAGGGYGTSGTLGDTYGGRPAEAGVIYGNPSLTKLFPGAGGGGGHPNGGKPHGGNGGGIIYIVSDSLTVASGGTLSSDGQDGYAVGGDDGTWGAGGGAGGSIYLISSDMSLGSSLVHALGGTAFDGYNGSGDGGDGGKGRIRLEPDRFTLSLSG